MVEGTAFPNLFVIPIDFNTASLNACYYALELADKYKARVKLIHTYAEPDVRPMSLDDSDFYAETISINEIREEAEKKLELFLQKIDSELKIKATTNVPIIANIINGTPDEAILYSSETEKANIIIMGISGEEVRSFEPMGKIASKIIEESTIPVLIIPEDMEFNGFNKLKNILYITEFDESDFSAIGKLISIIKDFETNIFCLHIGNENESSWEKLKMDGLKEYMNNVYGKTNVETDLIYSKDMLHAIDDFIVQKNIDLIAITNHKRNIISKLINPSITQKILYHTHIPLIVFHG